MAGTEQMAAQMAGKRGSSPRWTRAVAPRPGALRQYGIPDDAYHGS